MADLKNIRHVFFDLDDTLWDFKKNSEVVLKDLFVEFSLAEKLKTDFNIFFEEYRKTNRQIWSDYYQRTIDKAYLRNQRFYLVFKSFDYDNFDESLRISEHYLALTPKGHFLKDHCIDVLEHLGAKYQLYIITNGFRDVQDIKLNSTGIRKYFKHIIISEDYDLVKPQKEIFDLAKNLAGAQSAQCLMIGDSLESDVEGAERAGWKSILFDESGTENFSGKKITNLRELKFLL